MINIYEIFMFNLLFSVYHHVFNGENILFRSICELADKLRENAVELSIHFFCVENYKYFKQKYFTFSFLDNFVKINLSHLKIMPKLFNHFIKFRY